MDFETHDRNLIDELQSEKEELEAEITALRARLAEVEGALQETLKKPDGWLVDEGFMLVDPKDKYAIPLYYISPELAALAQSSET